MQQKRHRQWQNEAYHIWREDLQTKAIDHFVDLNLRSHSEKIDPLRKAFIQIEMNDFPQALSWNSLCDESLGQLGMVREALFLSSNEIAGRLGITKRAYLKFEKSEERGAIQLGNLRRIAKAMDCELIYMIRPISKRNYSEELWQKILPEALKRLEREQVFEKSRARRLAAIAKTILESQNFRTKHKITQRRKTFD